MSFCIFFWAQSGAKPGLEQAPGSASRAMARDRNAPFSPGPQATSDRDLFMGGGVKPNEGPLQWLPKGALETGTHK